VPGIIKKNQPRSGNKNTVTMLVHKKINGGSVLAISINVKIPHMVSYKDE
jgi:hypothetical protein